MNDLNKAISIVAIWGGAGLIAMGKDNLANIILGILALTTTLVVCGIIPLNWWKAKAPSGQIIPPNPPPV
jgi:hypothetical protein